MASAAEAIRDRLAALNLLGRTGDLQVQGRGAAGMQFEQPGDHDHACQANGDRQQSRQACSTPFQEIILCLPAAKARPGQ